MKVRELKEQLESIPDDAEVTYKLHFDVCSKCNAIKDLEQVSLAFTLGPQLMQIYITKEYEELPK